MAAAWFVIAVAFAGACSGSSQPGISNAGTSSTTPAGTAAARSSRVDVYGDSLTLQTNDALRVEGKAHGLTVTVNAFFGLAPCDVAKYVLADLKRAPDALVIAFSGNNLSPCMQVNGKDIIGAAYYAKYRRDVEALVAAALARKIPTFVVGAPIFPASQNHPDRVKLDEVYESIVAAHSGARYVPSAPFVSPHGFVWTLPCGPGESAALGCHGGQITVREGNGIHFDDPHKVPCPSGHDVCSYSAGGHRYADAILTGLSRLTSLTYQPAPSTAGVPIDTTKDG